MKAMIIAAPGVQDQEFVYPYYRLQEAGYQVDVAVPDGKVRFVHKSFQGIGGLWLPSTQGLPILPTELPDILILPGGVKAMEKLRLDEGLLEFIAEVDRRGLPIGSICSGAQLLISAKIVRGRRITAYPAMRVDVSNAGATYIEEPVVTDRNLVTSLHYWHLGPWMAAVLQAARELNAFRKPATCAAAL